jgi:hypothetical protein
MGNLLYRHQPISEIKKLRYAELKQWNEWHEMMVKAEEVQIEKAKGKPHA